MPRFADRVDRIVQSATVAVGGRVAALRRAGTDVVSFAAGEPDFDTPDHIKQAAIESLKQGRTKYGPAAGEPELRAAAARFHEEDGITATAENVLVTPAKHGVLLGVLTVAGAGDEVLVPDPSWVSYAPMIQWAHARPVGVPLDEARGFAIDPDAVASRITKKTRAIILNSPSNPTGGVDGKADVRGVMELAEDHDLWVISDELYTRIQYGHDILSPASLPGMFDRTITIYGLSKSFAMTGWRVGWTVASKQAVKEMTKLQSHSLTCVAPFVQDAALAALQGPQDFPRKMVEEFRVRRDLMVNGLRKLSGVSCPTPGGAFYAFPRFDPEVWGDDDAALALRLLEDTHVATTPGSAFGARGKGHLRFSYATGRDRIEEGLRRLREA